MSTMDLITFHQHALQWKYQQEEAERLAAEETAKQTTAEWKKIAEVIREALPIEGMTIHETIKGQFKELPRKGIIYTVDCQIDPTRREQMKVPPNNGRSMDGVIRVQVVVDTEENKTEWTIYGYEVWVDGRCERFSHANAAFLAAYAGLQVQ